MGCSLCGVELIAPGLLPDALCPVCGGLFDWFRGFYADENGRCREEWIGLETTFHELSVESLESVEMLIEAQERFGLAVTDWDAEGMKTVGDFLRYIRANIGGGKSPGGRSPRPSVGSDPMWDGQMDA